MSDLAIIDKPQQGDSMRITTGKHRGKIGSIDTVGRDTWGWPLYLITLDACTFLFYFDEVERAERRVRHA